MVSCLATARTARSTPSPTGLLPRLSTGLHTHTLHLLCGLPDVCAQHDFRSHYDNFLAWKRWRVEVVRDKIRFSSSWCWLRANAICYFSGSMHYSAMAKRSSARSATARSTRCSIRVHSQMGVSSSSRACSPSIYAREYDIRPLVDHPVSLLSIECFNSVLIGWVSSG